VAHPVVCLRSAFFFQAEDGIRDGHVTGVQTCALPIFGQSPTEASISAVTRDEVIAFCRNYFKPGRALVTVVGDVNAASAKSTVERALSTWQAGGDKPAFSYPQVPAPRATTIFIVDKPAAPQSTFAIGLP